MSPGDLSLKTTMLFFYFSQFFFSFNGFLPLVNVLLSANADVNARDMKNVTPLHVAALKVTKKKQKKKQKLFIYLFIFLSRVMPLLSLLCFVLAQTPRHALSKANRLEKWPLTKSDSIILSLFRVSVRLTFVFPSKRRLSICFLITLLECLRPLLLPLRPLHLLVVVVVLVEMLLLVIYHHLQTVTAVVLRLSSSSTSSMAASSSVAKHALRTMRRTALLPRLALLNDDNRWLSIATACSCNATAVRALALLRRLVVVVRQRLHSSNSRHR
jgi:hypothetical protein